MVECIIEQIKHMESNIKTAKKGDFRIALHKLEVIIIFLNLKCLKIEQLIGIQQLDRIKFMLVSYLRIRIKKVFIS